MDYDPYHSIRHTPKDLLGRFPFAGRLVIMVGFFALLAPIFMLVSGKNTTKVQTTGREGVAVVSPVVSDGPALPSLPPTVVASESPTYTDTTPSTLPPDITASAATAGTAPQLAVNAAAIQNLPDAVPVNQAPATAAKPAAKPATTAAKSSTTAAKPAGTAKPATSAAKPVTTAAKPATTVAKPATTVKPVVTTPKTPVTTAKPVPTTKAIPRYSATQVVALIRQMWPADSVDKALDVANKESGYDARAFNGWCCYGVFQINYSSQYGRLAARGLGLEYLYDAKVNIEIALEMFNEQGWAPWTTA